MRTLVLGDVHGAFRALAQAWTRANVSDLDKVVFVGDVCDGWPDTMKCVDFLWRHATVLIMGNHDMWLDDYRRTGSTPGIWTSQGGRATLESINSHPSPARLLDKYFGRVVPYHVDGDRLFVHGGYWRGAPIETQPLSVLAWDRDLWNTAGDGMDVSPYSEVYVGHTATRENTPVNRGPVWNIDQGAGWKGVLTMMDVDTKESWQSDPVHRLYPGEPGRYR